MSDLNDLSVSYEVLTAICALTVFALCFVVARVVRVAKCSDPIFVIMLVCLQLALVSNVLFYQLQLRWVENDRVGPAYYCSNACLDSAPALWLAFATLLNTNKWIYFNWRLTALKFCDFTNNQDIDARLQPLAKA